MTCIRHVYWEGSQLEAKMSQTRDVRIIKCLFKGPVPHQGCYFSVLFAIGLPVSICDCSLLDSNTCHPRCLIHTYTLGVSNIHTFLVSHTYIHSWWLIYTYTLGVSNIHTYIHTYILGVSYIHTLQGSHTYIHCWWLIYTFTQGVSYTHTLLVAHTYIHYRCFIHTYTKLHFAITRAVPGHFVSAKQSRIMYLRWQPFQVIYTSALSYNAILKLGPLFNANIHTFSVSHTCIQISQHKRIC